MDVSAVGFFESVINIFWLWFICIAFTAQGVKFRVFQQASVIYFFVAIIGYIVILRKQYSLRIEVPDFFKMLVCAIIRVLNDQGFFFAASVSPVGNLDGLKAASIVVMALVYDFYKQRVTKYKVLAAVIAFIGVMLLSQPWAKTKVFGSSVKVTPCKTFGLRNIDMTQLPSTLNVSRNGTDDLLNHRSQSAYSLQSKIFGYSSIVHMTIGVTVRGFLIKEVMS